MTYNLRMSDDERKLEANSGFETTHWSVVLDAGGSTSIAREALARLCEAYWYPLYAYARRRIGNKNDAQDVIQEFFLHILQRECLSVADPNRGRFRSFLLTSLKNFLTDQVFRLQDCKIL